MKQLSTNQKRFIFGGAKKAAVKTKAKRTASDLTKWNNRLYIAGQASISITSLMEHFNYSIPKLISAINSDEQNFTKHEQKGARQLRPNFRFSKDFWNSSITYGSSPWYF